MSKSTATALALKRRPIWIFPMVTALVVVAALMVFYSATPPV
jgi:paraquat-inducible protein B